MKSLAHLFNKVNSSELSTELSTEKQLPQLHVPAEGSSRYLTTNKILTRKAVITSAGTLYLAPLKTLRQPGLVLKQWDNLFVLLLALTNSPKGAEMLKECLRLQATCGRAFPSARYLASYANASEKTWDRTLAALRDRGWVKVERLLRANGQQSVNLLDLSALWEEMKKLLASHIGLARSVGHYIWVKVGCLWLSKRNFALPGLSPSPRAPG